MKRFDPENPMNRSKKYLSGFTPQWQEFILNVDKAITKAIDGKESLLGEEVIAVAEAEFHKHNEKYGSLSEVH